MKKYFKNWLTIMLSIVMLTTLDITSVYGLSGAHLINTVIGETERVNTNTDEESNEEVIYEEENVTEDASILEYRQPEVQTTTPAVTTIRMNSIQEDLEVILENERIERERRIKQEEYEKRVQAELAKYKKNDYTSNFTIHSDMNTHSRLQPDEIKYLLRRYNVHDNIDTLAETIYHTDIQGVNAYFILSVGALESGWGKRTVGDKKNWFGIMAYDGNEYQAAKRFRSDSECFKYFSWMMREGKYYFTRGNNTLYEINKVYASNVNWKNDVARIMNLLEADIDQYRLEKNTQ